MSVKRIGIGNSTALNVIDTEKFKTNFLSVNFVLPLKRETASKNALLFRVLQRGSEKYPTVAALNGRLDYLYATTVGLRNYKRGEAQIIGLAAEMLDNDYADGTDLVFEVCDFIRELIFKPLLGDDGLFLSNYVEQEKENLINDIQAKINDKRRFASFRCYEEMCRGEAFGISELGTEEDTAKITPASLYRHYLDVIKKARIEVFFVGRCEPALLEKNVRAVFSGVDREESEPIVTDIIKNVKKVRYVEDKLPVTQGKLSLGFRTCVGVNDPDYQTLVMFNEIFGGSVASKLFMNVRERLSLCYYCSSSLESYKGTMMVNSGIEFDKREVAEREIMAQLDALRGGDISDYEYSSAKRSLKNSFMHMLDSPTSMELYYLGRMIVGVFETIEDTAKKFEGVSKEDISAVAKNVKLDTVYFMSKSEEAVRE